MFCSPNPDPTDTATERATRSVTELPTLPSCRDYGRGLFDRVWRSAGHGAKLLNVSDLAYTKILPTLLLSLRHIPIQELSPVGVLMNTRVSYRSRS